jgi:hypothetical protein
LSTIDAESYGDRIRNYLFELFSGADKAAKQWSPGMHVLALYPAHVRSFGLDTDK